MSNSGLRFRILEFVRHIADNNNDHLTWNGTMIQFTVQIPKVVRNEPRYVQEAYVREFTRVEEQTGDVLTALNSANILLRQLRRKSTNHQQQIKDLIEASMDVQIHAHISEISAYDCLPPSILSQIKSTDPHPFFAVYDIGGEGISTGLRDNRRERKIWSFSAIKELAKKIKDNVAGVIHGHNELNQDNKPKYGRIVHAFTKTIHNSLHAIAVAHITNSETIEKIKSGKLDICSIEGNVLLARDTIGGNWFVKKIQNIVNLALESSAVSKPGFQGAGILATIQELSKGE